MSFDFSQNTILTLGLILVSIVILFFIIREVQNLQAQLKFQKTQIRRLKNEILHGVVHPDMTRVGYHQIEPANDLEQLTGFILDPSVLQHQNQRYPEEQQLNDENGLANNINDTIDDTTSNNDINNFVEEETISRISLNLTGNDETDKNIDDDTRDSKVNQSKEEINITDKVDQDKEEISIHDKVDQNKDDTTNISDVEQNEKVSLLPRSRSEINSEEEISRPKLRVQFKKKD